MSSTDGSAGGLIQADFTRGGNLFRSVRATCMTAGAVILTNGCLWSLVLAFEHGILILAGQIMLFTQQGKNHQHRLSWQCITAGGVLAVGA